MEVMIHACPQRMWYVEDFLIPSLEAQGVEKITVWNDAKRRGNLHACMDAFASRTGNGAAWHIQDDVLICRDFKERCLRNDRGVVWGFCCQWFLDDPTHTGTVYAEDAWNSFQCVRIPDEYARGCAEWFFSGEWQTCPEQELFALYQTNRGDDAFFRNYFIEKHGTEMVTNLKPNLVEHVDRLIGGSALDHYRDYFATAHYWEDPDLTEELRQRLQEYRRQKHG